MFLTHSVDSRCVFELIAVETLRVFNSSARLLLDEIGKRICFNTGEIRETSFLFQRVSVLVRRFNTIPIPFYYTTLCRSRYCRTEYDVLSVPILAVLRPESESYSLPLLGRVAL